MPRALTLSTALADPWAVALALMESRKEAQRACRARHGSSPSSFPSRAQGEEGEEVEAEF